MPLCFTYNVAIGVGILKQTKQSIFTGMQNTAEFSKMLKIGIYKSLCKQGIISDYSLMQLIQIQRSEKVCR